MILFQLAEMNPLQGAAKASSCDGSTSGKVHLREGEILPEGRGLRKESVRNNLASTKVRE